MAKVSHSTKHLFRAAIVALVGLCCVAGAIAQEVVRFDAGKVALMSPYQLSELFREANALAESDGYAGASARYEALIDAGVADPVLFFNSGNAFAEMGERGLAVWRYEQARRLDPRHEDARFNLSMLAPPENDRPLFVMLRPFTALSGAFSLGEAIGLASLGWFVALLLLSIVALSRRRSFVSRWARRTGWLSISLFIAFVLIAGSKAYNQRVRDWAVVTATSATGHVAPRDNARDELDIPAGWRVLVTDRSTRGWVEARLPDGRRTYLRASDVRSL